MTCAHDIIEMDNACADGMCPLCLADEIERLRTLLREAISYDSQIVHIESWWRKVRALEPKP